MRPMSSLWGGLGAPKWKYLISNAVARPAITVSVKLTQSATTNAACRAADFAGLLTLCVLVVTWAGCGLYESVVGGCIKAVGWHCLNIGLFW